MTKPRERAKKAKVEKAAAQLLEALAFVALAQNPKSEFPHERHCLMQGGTVTGTSGALTAGARIIEQLDACPHTETFRDRLAKCGATLNLSVDGPKIRIASGRASWQVEGIEAGQFPPMMPDPQLIAFTDRRFRDALEAVSVLAVEGGRTLIESTILVYGDTAMSTNRIAMLEYWHGMGIPVALSIPKMAIASLAKVKKELTGFGASSNSVTFWFEDESFLKSRLVDFQWPMGSVAKILNVDANPWPLPDDFFAGVEALLDVTELNKLDFMGDHLVTSDGKGRYDMEGLPKDVSYSAKFLTILKPYIQKVDWKGNQNGMVFYGENCRGSIARMV